MREQIIRVPGDMRDRLPGECALARRRESALAELFERGGYQEAATPVLEYYTLFTRTGCPLPEKEMTKVIDRAGRICVLRPDSTAPIARLVSTRLKNQPLPIKLWYAQTVYREDGARGCYQLRQAGAEAIGVTNDAEILELAAQATAIAYSGKVPHIEVSHAGALQTLFSRLGYDEARISHALSLIRRKNFAALGDELPDSEPLLALTRLSGGAEAIGRAEQLLETELPELRALTGSNITVDFSLAPSVGYYTGIFFTGFVEGAPGAVLNGGRYDSLLGLLGRPAPAVGFALTLE